MRKISLLCLSVSASLPNNTALNRSSKAYTTQFIQADILTLTKYYSQPNNIQYKLRCVFHNALTQATTNIVHLVVSNHFYELSQDMQELLVKIKSVGYWESFLCHIRRDRDKFCAGLRAFMIDRRDRSSTSASNARGALVLINTNYCEHYNEAALLITDDVKILAKYVNWKSITIPKVKRTST